MWAVLPILALLFTASFASAEQAGDTGKGKMKVVYHVDGKDPEVAKYALSLIHKHIEAEGGPKNIDIKLVIHGPALPLFDMVLAVAVGAVELVPRCGDGAGGL